VADLRKVCGECVYIIHRKADKIAGFLSAGLHGSAVGDYDHQLAAEIGKNVRAGLAKAISVGEQHDYGRNAPRHTEHGKCRTPAIVAHGCVGFLEQIAKHVYSCLSASTGCSKAAFRAG